MDCHTGGRGVCKCDFPRGSHKGDRQRPPPKSWQNIFTHGAWLLRGGVEGQVAPWAASPDNTTGNRHVYNCHQGPGTD
eukprot:10669733-Karenia_brevis.AAC.1